MNDDTLILKIKHVACYVKRSEKMTPLHTSAGEAIDIDSGASQSDVALLCL
jgi:hypothetical protein